MEAQGADRVPIDPQSIDAPLSQSAVFLVVTVGSDAASTGNACATLAGLDDLLKTVAVRDVSARLSCIVGIGHALWQRVVGGTLPRELKPFAPLQGAVHSAPATPGDLLFHIRAERADLVFELERQLLISLGDSVRVVDEVSGFRYFDARDLLGFVDGTANPTARDLYESALVGDEDPAFCGGSYVVVQKYLHDLDAWAKIPTPVQEAIVGRTKWENVEIDDDAAPRKSHKSLTTIVDEQGVEHDILRDNMPFGRPGQGEFGTYFIGYSRHLWVIEKMLKRMYVGEPPGAYDRLLDVSVPQTGTTFFAPSRATLSAWTSIASESFPADPQA